MKMKNGISREDPQAVEKLQAKLGYLQAFWKDNDKSFLEASAPQSLLSPCNISCRVPNG